MFCLNQLFVHSQKAELTTVWHAATLSEIQFKKRYKSGTINKLNVAKICKQIQEIAYHKNKSGIKFSLHLLSYLMCGVTRLHLYQVAYYEKDVFEFHKNLATKERKEQNFDAMMNFDSDPVNVPLRTKINLQFDENLHLSQYQNLDDGLQIMMTATVGQDFGALTDKEMNIMCEPDIMLMEERLRTAHYSEGRDDTMMIEDIEITEIHQERSSSQTSLGPMFVSIFEANAKLSMTPQKREIQAQSQVDTPTKRRRLSFEEIVVSSTVVTEDIRVPISQQVTPIAQQIESDMILQSLKSFESYSSTVKKSKHIIDKNTILNDKLCIKWWSSTNSWCKNMEIAKPHLTLAEILLTQPSHKRCANRLYSLFTNHLTFNRITGPSSVNENIVSADSIRLAESHAKESSRVLTELSGLGKTNMMADDSTVIHEASTMPLEMVVPDTIIAAEGVTKDITKGENYQKKDINMNEIKETLEDITILLERQHLKNDFVSESPARSSRTSQNIPLTNQDILAMLETLLYDKEYVTFNDFIPDTYSARDKIQAFNLLLELHAQRRVALVQEDCHSILYIYKFDI